MTEQPNWKSEKGDWSDLPLPADSLSFALNKLPPDVAKLREEAQDLCTHCKQPLVYWPGLGYLCQQCDGVQ